MTCPGGDQRARQAASLALRPHPNGQHKPGPLTMFAWLTNRESTRKQAAELLSVAIRRTERQSATQPAGPRTL